MDLKKIIFTCIWVTNRINSKLIFHKIHFGYVSNAEVDIWLKTSKYINLIMIKLN